MTYAKPKPTLDQQRAKYAWECAAKRSLPSGYETLAKGAAALIMGSGLMAALAYWNSRSSSNKDAARPSSPISSAG